MFSTKFSFAKGIQSKTRAVFLVVYHCSQCGQFYPKYDSQHNIMIKFSWWRVFVSNLSLLPFYTYVYMWEKRSIPVFNRLTCLPPVGDAYKCQWMGSALVQIMACCLFSTKPLSKPMLPTRQQTVIWTNDGYITSTYMCQSASVC